MAKDADLRRLLDRQAEELDRMESAELRRILRIYEETRQELSTVMADMEATGLDVATPFTYQRHHAVLAQVEAAVQRMRGRISAEMVSATTSAGERSIGDLLSVLSKAEDEFSGVAAAIETRAVRRLGEVNGLLLHRHSLDRYTLQTVEDIQRELLIGVTRKQSYRDLRRRLFGVQQRNAYESVWLAREHRLKLIVQMERAKVSDEVHRASLDEAAAVLDVEGGDDPLMARADEFRDRRNHPLSPALHGQLRRLDEDWVVQLAEVQAWEAFTKYKGPPSSITWPLVDGAYVGRTYPAHFGDRGRQTAWRRSWGDAGELTVDRDTPAKSMARAGVGQVERDGFLRGIGRPPIAEEIRDSTPILRDMENLRPSHRSSSAAGLGRLVGTADGRVAAQQLNASWFRGQLLRGRADVYRLLARQGEPGEDLRWAFVAELREAGRVARQGAVEFRAARSFRGVKRQIDIIGKDEIVEVKRTRDYKSARKLLGRPTVKDDVDLMAAVGGDRVRTLAIHIDSGEKSALPTGLAGRAARLEALQPGTRIELVLLGDIRMRYDPTSKSFVEVK